MNFWHLFKAILLYQSSQNYIKVKFFLKIYIPNFLKDFTQKHLQLKSNQKRVNEFLMWMENEILNQQLTLLN